ELEIDALVARRRATEAAPVDEQQAIVVGERALLAPGLFAPAEAPVNENGRLTIAPSRHVQLVRTRHRTSLTGVRSDAVVTAREQAKPTIGPWISTSCFSARPAPCRRLSALR